MTITMVRSTLRRIARFYRREPQFVCCSATIANPGELASRLLETEVQVLDSNGAPAAEKTFVFYNPPVVNRALGIRRIAVVTGQRVGKGELLLTLEAMKLEHPVLAPHAGTVTAVPVAEGQQVDAGAVLAVIERE